MSFVVRCPHCDTPSRFADRRRGTRLRCPECDKQFEEDASKGATSTNSRTVVVAVVVIAVALVCLVLMVAGVVAFFAFRSGT